MVCQGGAIALHLGYFWFSSLSFLEGFHVSGCWKNEILKKQKNKYWKNFHYGPTKAVSIYFWDELTPFFGNPILSSIIQIFFLKIFCKAKFVFEIFFVAENFKGKKGEWELRCDFRTSWTKTLLIAFSNKIQRTDRKEENPAFLDFQASFPKYLKTRSDENNEKNKKNKTKIQKFNL